MKQLDPKATWLFFVSFVLRGLFAIIILPFWLWLMIQDVTEGEDAYIFDFLGWYWLIIPAFVLVCYLWAYLTNYFYRYDLTEPGFRKESGIIYKRYITIPYDRIQNVDINRGIVARILGLSDLQIQTAGASAVVTRWGGFGVGAEGRLPGLSQGSAEKLRDELIERARRSKTQGV